MYKFIGKDSNSLIQIHEEPSKGAGDKVTVGLRMQLSAGGVQGDGTLEGMEEALVTYSDSFVINQLRNAVKSGGKMSDQRVPFSVREQAMIGLSDWWSDRIDLCGLNQLCGNSAQTDTRYTGNNTVTAPSSNNRYYANGLSSDASVVSASASNVMDLNFIDYAVEIAKTNSPAIRPIKYMGNDYYVMFLHPYQVTDLRTNASAGQWFDIQSLAMAGLKDAKEVEKNPIFTGALGVYNGVVLHESTRIPRVAQLAGDVGTTKGVYRAVLCGAQSLLMAFGQDNSDMKASWVEEKFDYSNSLGVSAGMIFGMKKAIFNSQDFGTVTVATYAAPAA